MKVDEDRIGAFVDDELTSAEADALSRAAADDPVLARRIDRQRRLRSRLGGAHAFVFSEPPPERFMRLLDQERPRSGWRYGWVRAAAPAGVGFALAASIAVAVGLVNGAPDGDLALSKAGVLVAKGSLAQALDHRLGTEADPAGRIRLIESFRSDDGLYCRIFRTGASAQITGLACKHASRWTIASLASQGAEEGASYRQAGSPLPRAVTASLDELRLSQPLTAAEEASARAAGWRRPPPGR